jgi:hypothetical protein
MKPARMAAPGYDRLHPPGRPITGTLTISREARQAARAGRRGCCCGDDDRVEARRPWWICSGNSPAHST